MQKAFVGNTHLVAGGSETIGNLVAMLRERGVATKGDPDLYVRTYKSFGIDEARELRDRAALRPVASRRVFILAMPDMTREAQNALLKTIEEPPANALFFFILRSPETLLSTFRSRAQMLSVESAPSAGHVDARQFLAAAPAKRLLMLKPLLEKDEDDPSTGPRAGKRDLGAVLLFLASLEGAFMKKTDVEGLRAIYRARKYATDKGALLKPLLEQLALLAPHV